MTGLQRWTRQTADKLLCPSCLAFGLGLILRSALAAMEPLEYQVKAAFLLNFTKFVEWPAAAFAAADSPIAICILGE